MHIHGHSKAEHSNMQQSEVSQGTVSLNSFFECGFERHFERTVATKQARATLSSAIVAMVATEQARAAIWRATVAMKQARPAVATKQARAVPKVAPVRPRKSISSAQVTPVGGKIAMSVILEATVAKMQ